MKNWTGFATSARTAWILALLPILLGGVLMGVLGEAERDRLPTDQLPRGYDSTGAVALADELPEAEGSTAVVVFSADEGQLTPAQLGAAGGVLQSISGAAPVLIPAEDGTAALGILTLDAKSASEVSDEVGQVRSKLAAGLPAGVTAQVTGPAGIEADLAAVFEGANFRLLAVTALVVAILLIVTYRSPVLWMIPLLVVGVADRTAGVLATHVLANFDVAWDESTVGILSVLVFGAGTNYALLLISRYRDELRRSSDRRAAMRIALPRTAEPVLASAGTVVVGLLCLLLSLIPTTRGLGLACAVGVVTAVFFALVCLPSMLVLFPRGIFWPRVPHEGDTTAAQTRSAWRRIGDQVAKRPVAVGGAVVAALAVLALGNLSIQLGLATADQFLTKPEAIAAAERIAESFPAGTANPTTVITRADAAQVSAEVGNVPGVASVSPAASGAGITQLQVVLDFAEGSAQSQAAIVAIRDAVASYPDTHVGGPEAQTIDGTAAAARDRGLIIPIILGFVLLALCVLLRAVLAPVLLVCTVVGTYFASLGASWLIFRHLLGFSALDEGVPLMAFLFLVALGVDYNIFLVTRAREEGVAHGAREGMLRALGATGGVITSAGVLLAAVFAVLGVLPLVVLAQLGVVVCLGVLLDTLVVRTMLVPALALVLGDRFWWPQRRVAPDAGALVGVAP
ncbi:MAG: MMPL family transporter [Candidatus Nanopelagicales bacterium]